VTLRCWQCGVEPTGTVNVQTFTDPGPVYVATGWPPGNHEHAEHPPTPAELERDGHRSLRRILEDV
jgi:hypothetical protein